MVRNMPNKRTYFNLIWEDFTLTQLLNYQMNHVFSTPENEAEDVGGSGIQFLTYLNTLMSSIGTKLKNVKMEKESMDRLIVRNFILKGLNQMKGADDGLVLKFDKAI